MARALMQAVIGLAATRGARQLLLSTQPGMRAAQGLYMSLGFARMAALDWSPAPGVTLLAFGLSLAAGSGRDAQVKPVMANDAFRAALERARP